MAYGTNSFSYGTPLTLADFGGGGTYSAPTFERFAGTSLNNLLGNLADLKLKVQAPGLAESGRQFDVTSGLRGQELSNQLALGQGQTSAQLALGQGSLANQLRLAELQDALERSRLGETGRQFDVTSGLQGDQQQYEQDALDRAFRQQQERYAYLLEMLGNPNTQAAALKALTGYTQPSNTDNAAKLWQLASLAGNAGGDNISTIDWFAGNPEASSARKVRWPI